MFSRQGILALLVMAAMLVACGCSAEQGLRDGVQKGLSSGLSALISAPFNTFIDQTFP